MVKHISAQDADLVVGNGELPAKSASHEKHFGINDFRGAGTPVEANEKKALLRFAV
jgi:hypothetical protein